MKKNISNTKGKDLKWVIPNLVDLAKMGQISSHGQETPSSCTPGTGASACAPGTGATLCGGGSSGV